MTRIIFHRLNKPLFSWIMTECKNAVPDNHGMKAAFSTGSQAQYPPHPSTSYAQRLPKINPMDKNIQATNVHLLVKRIHRSSFLPVMSAAIPKAYGMTNETNPR